MPRRILVPLDGSEFAEAAIPAARALARRTRGELRLLCVLEMPPILVIPEFYSPDRAWADAYLADVAKRVGGAGVPITTAVREGQVVDEILGEARSWSAELIAMTTHGRGGPSRLWMGSVADRCLRVSDRPILLIRAEKEAARPADGLDVRRVVVPLDGSELAEGALPLAVELAKTFAAPMLLLRAIPHLGVVGLDDLADASGLTHELRAEAERQVTGYLDERTAGLRRDGIAVEGEVVQESGPARAIAEREPGDLVVMSTQGRGGIGRAILGSVADKVVRSATGPVVVVPRADAAD